MGTDYESIYRERAADYDRLVSAEDCDGNLLPAIERVTPLAGARVVEVGVGTGRVTRLLVSKGALVIGFDRSEAMLAIARRRLAEVSATGWEVRCADAQELPVASSSADLAIAGWVFGHLRSWNADEWRQAIGRGIDEMARAVRPGGALILLETLGTGSEVPRPPNPELAEYYDWLEGDRGFTREALRTDYLFPDAETAAGVMGFFFGEAFVDRIRGERWTRVPECSGLWWRRQEG